MLYCGSLALVVVLVLPHEERLVPVPVHAHRIRFLHHFHQYGRNGLVGGSDCDAI